MTRHTTFTFDLTGPLSDFVAARVGEEGAYKDAGEYIRDLIRRDRERLDGNSLARLRTELAGAFAASDDDHEVLTAAQVIARNPR